MWYHRNLYLKCDQLIWKSKEVKKRWLTFVEYTYCESLDSISYHQVQHLLPSCRKENLFVTNLGLTIFTKSKIEVSISTCSCRSITAILRGSMGLVVLQYFIFTSFHSGYFCVYTCRHIYRPTMYPLAKHMDYNVYIRHYECRILDVYQGVYMGPPIFYPLPLSPLKHFLAVILSLFKT